MTDLCCIAPLLTKVYRPCKGDVVYLLLGELFNLVLNAGFQKTYRHRSIPPTYGVMHTTAVQLT